jgi:hypothetical protein
MYKEGDLCCHIRASAFTSPVTRANLFSRTAIVAPGGWATAKRPFSEFVAARTLPSKRNSFLPICQ